MPGVTSADDQHRLIKTINDRLTEKPEDLIWIGQTLSVIFGDRLPKKNWTDYGIKLTYPEATELRAMTTCRLITDNLRHLPPSRSTMIDLYQLAKRKPNVFQMAIKDGTINPLVFRSTIRDLRRHGKPPERLKVERIDRPTGGAFLNRVVCGDCLDLIPQLPDNSIDTVITSPPYAEQRADYYHSIPEESFPEWFCARMKALWPKMIDDGSVLVVIRPHLKDGEVSDYLHRTVLTVRAAGWIEAGQLMWYKPDAPPQGSIQRPRVTFEHILWFSKSRSPYIDVKACGKMSNRIGYEDADRFALSGTSPLKKGIARIPDVIVAMRTENDRGVNHPAMFPRTLVRPLIQTFCRPKGTVLDPFVGSGTTILEARHQGRNIVGFDIEQEYVDLTNDRLRNDKRYT